MCFCMLSCIILQVLKDRNIKNIIFNSETLCIHPEKLQTKALPDSLTIV